MGAYVKFRDKARTIGFGNTCLFIAARVANAMTAGRLRIIKYYFMAQPIVAGTDITRSGVFSLSWADADCPQLSQSDRSPAVIAARFAQGARCLLATAEGAEFAGFLWFVIGPYDEDEVRAKFCPMPNGEAAWDFDVTVAPRYRMGRLFSYLWSRACAELADHGVRQTLSRISAFNDASLAAHRRLGGRIVGRAVFVCAGRWQIMKASMSPRWHVSWREDQRPTLRIGAEVDSRPPR